MSSQLYNNVTDSLSLSVGSTDTSITVTDGSKFPNPPSGDYIPLYIIRASDQIHEIVHVTSVSGNVLTVTRQAEGTDPLVFNSGDAVQIRPTRQSLLDMDVVTYTATGDEGVSSALNKRVFSFQSVSDIKSIESPETGWQASISTDAAKIYEWRAGDFTSEVSGDPSNSIYIEWNGDSSPGATGAWVRSGDGFGFYGDGNRDANSIAGDNPHWLEVSNNPGDGSSGNQLFRMNSYGNIAYGNNIHSCRYYGDETTPTAIQSGAFLMSWGFRGYDGVELSQSALAFQAEATENWSGSAHGCQFAWETTPNGSTSRSRSMVLDPNGNLLVGATSGGAHSLYKDVADDAGVPVLIIGQPGFASAWYGVTGTGANVANASLRINKDNVTNRSINAGGTINASGADYAEYMRKADGCGGIAKGDVLGIDENGQLTDQFDAAISFAIKSTDPSYVGGDTWGSEEALGRKEPVQPTLEADDLRAAREDAEKDAQAKLNEARRTYSGDKLQPHIEAFSRAVTAAADTFDSAMSERDAAYQADMEQYRADMVEFKDCLEAERQHWDRVAFSGRVPVNVQGATPGDYLIPEQSGDGGITARPVADPSFEEYRISVGRVASIQEDGRPIVIVKVS